MKKLRKLLCVVLSFCLVLCTLCLSAGAAYSENNDYKAMYPELYSLSQEDEVYPTIILPGINHSPYYLADENGNAVTDKNGNALESSLLLLNESSLRKNVLSLLPNALASLISQKDMGLSAKVRKTVSELMSYMICDNDGNTVNNLVTKHFDYPVSKMDDDTRGWFYRMIPVEPLADIIGEDNLFIYTFDLFGDPMKGAAELDGYIENVLSQTGAKKVNIASISLGGTMLTAYMDCGKNISKINRIVNIVSLLDGTNIMTDLMSRQFNLKDDFLYKDYFPMILEELAGSSDIGYFVNILLRILPRSLFNSVVSAAYDGLHELLLNNPQFWAMIPKADYPALADKYLSASEKSVLRAKTDRFQQARENLNKNLLSADKNGSKIFTISGCDLSGAEGSYCFFGITASSQDINSDGIIPCVSTSLGATAAAPKKTLSQSYIDSSDSKYISPSKTVDASTCLFPERAWFFSGQQHEIGRNDVAIRLACAIISGRVSDIHSSSAFAQFNSNRNTRSLVRSDNGYMVLAKAAMTAGDTDYTTSQLEALGSAYNECLEMLGDTSCNQKKADEATDKLISALADMGIAKLPEPKKETKFSFLKLASDILYVLFKGNGYFEKLV